MRAAHGGIAVAGAASWLDSSWSQRFTGHLENGQPSITG
jgi:hypothetical protein